MKRGLQQTGRVSQLARPTLMALLATLSLITPSLAVQWQPLAQTTRHNVALDKDSLRLNSLGKLTVWLRFTPRGERQRREAARQYGNADYRLHLEYYEIDCGDQSAVMGQVDILGAGGRRLARQKGGGQPDTIIPGSALDRAAQRVCPSLEETAAESDQPPETGDEEETAPEARKAEHQRKVTAALQRTRTEPDNATAWIELGNAYYDADQPPKAIDAYTRALALDPDNPDVLNDQGAMYRQTGDFQRALANFQRAVARDPHNLESLYNLGYVYAFDLNRPQQAREVWQRYLALDSTSEAARQVRTFLERSTKQE